MIYPPDRVPRFPNHSGRPQSGETYQFGDPGPAIGQTKSVTTSFGSPPSPWNTEPPECTFIGTEGIARATQQRMEIVRFADAPFVLVSPRFLDPKPEHSTYQWAFLNWQYAPLFLTEDRVFGAAAELAHAEFTAPRLLDAMRSQPPLRFWGARPTFVGVCEEYVEVQQHGRYDRVRPNEIEVSLEDGDIVLRADRFYEARFMIGETVNAKLLVAMLKTVAGK